MVCTTSAKQSRRVLSDEGEEVAPTGARTDDSRREPARHWPGERRWSGSREATNDSTAVDKAMDKRRSRAVRRRSRPNGGPGSRRARHRGPGCRRMARGWRCGGGTTEAVKRSAVERSAVARRGVLQHGPTGSTGVRRAYRAVGSRSRSQTARGTPPPRSEVAKAAERQPWQGSDSDGKAAAARQQEHSSGGAALAGAATEMQQ